MIDHTINYPLDLFFLEVLSVGLTSCEETTVNINPVGGGAYRCFSKESLIWPKFPEDIYDQLEPRLQEMCSELQSKGILKLFFMDKLCLPKDTEVKLIYTSYYKTIRLQNKFCTVDIDVTYYPGENRIKDWGTKESQKWKWILNIDDDTYKQFLYCIGRVYINAKFDKDRANHPDMPKYKEWVEALIKRLQWHFDSEKQLKEAEQEYLMYNDNITALIKKYEDSDTKKLNSNDPNSVYPSK